MPGAKMDATHITTMILLQENYITKTVQPNVLLPMKMVQVMHSCHVLWTTSVSNLDKFQEVVQNQMLTQKLHFSVLKVNGGNNMERMLSGIAIHANTSTN